MTKYVVFWEYDPDDVDKVREKSVKMQAERENAPKKYAKYLFPPHHIGYCKGFSVVDVSDPSQMTSAYAYWFPEIELQYVPIIENVELITT